MHPDSYIQKMLTSAYYTVYEEDRNFPPADFGWIEGQEIPQGKGEVFRWYPVSSFVDFQAGFYKETVEIVYLKSTRGNQVTKEQAHLLADLGKAISQHVQWMANPQRIDVDFQGPGVLYPGYAAMVIQYETIDDFDLTGDNDGAD